MADSGWGSSGPSPGSKDNRLLLDVRAAAAALSVSPRTAARLLAQGQLRAVRIGRRVLVDAASVRDLIEAGGTR